MWARGTFTFEHRLVLLSEGQADRRLMEKLVLVRRLPKFDFPWPVYGDEDANDTAAKLYGAGKFVDMLLALNGDFALNPELREQIRGVLIVADAKDCPKKTFDDICDQIKRAGKFSIPTRQGEIATGEEGHPAIGVILLPGDGKPGSLETLYVRALSARHRSAARCVEAFLSCGNIDITGWNVEKQAKARFQCLVAATNREDPSKSAAHALSLKRDGDRLIKMTQSSFTPAYKAIRQFCRELGVR